MLSYSTVDPDTLELLKNISSLSEMQDMRLVGGTSLALQYGHRKSCPHGLQKFEGFEKFEKLLLCKSLTD